jgi:RluA family pseudouridine synthase
VAITRLKLLATRKHHGKPLNQALADWLTEALGRPVSRAKARKLVIAGAVTRDGQRVTVASPALSPGATIEARIDLDKLFGDSTSRDREFELTAARILFEDEDLIVVDKPPGIPSHPTADQARNSLFTAVVRFLTARDGIANPYVGVHHRLDRDTSGVVLFTKSRDVNAPIAKSFADRAAIKTYQAITIFRPNVKKQWTIRNLLGKIPAKAKRARYGAVKSDGDVAETSFRVIAEHPGGIWIEAIPKTGRTHQIRVHLSECGLPILGDDLYGVSEISREFQKLAPRLMLHAIQLAFRHPVTGREISVKSPLPADFKQCLRDTEKHHA